LFRWLKKFHRCAANSGAGKRERLYLPLRIGDDGNPFNFAAVTKQEI
jgi:hypothetical protein